MRRRILTSEPLIGLRVVIRPGLEADLPALEWEGEYRHYRQVYRRAMEEARLGHRMLLLAEVEELVVGQIFIQLRDSDLSGKVHAPYGYMHAFRVREAYRNCGIGTQLVRQAERAMRMRGCERSTLAVVIENLRALKLYERLGYEIVGRDRGEWSYVDDQGRIRHVHEPSYVLEKALGALGSSEAQ